MKTNFLKKFLLLGIAFCFSTSLMFAQSLQWYKNWNSSGTQTDIGSAIAVDASGNEYVTGGANYPQGSDRYIETIKYNSSGVQQWVQSVNVASTSGNCDFEYGYCIAVDNKGDVWVAAAAYSATTGEDDDLTLIKYNASTGAVQTNYPKHYTDLDYCNGGASPRGCCLAVFDSTHVYIGGSTYADSTGKWAFIVLKDNPAGTGWAWTYTKSGTSAGTGKEHCATDLKADTNYVYATGWIQNTSQGKDCWTVKLNASTGALVWGQAYNNGSVNGDDVSNAMALDGNKNVYIAGYSTSSSNGKDALIVKYNSSGTLQWAKTYNNSSYNKDEVYTDIRYGKDTLIYTGGYMVKNTTTPDDDYLLSAYVTTTGNLTTAWGTNPVFYDGGSLAPEATGTDQGYAIRFEPTTNRVYITGKSDEGNRPKNVNITTRGYNASNGTNVWNANYAYGSNSIIADDQLSWKYCLEVIYDGNCLTDNVFVESSSYLAGTGYDYLTLRYGICAGCCKIAGLPDDVSQSNTELYPNPFSSEAILNVSSENPVSNASLDIYNMTGEKIRSQNNINTNSISIKRENLLPGIYFYKLSSKGQILSNGKFMIMN
jgi:hypothetical protein